MLWLLNEKFETSLPYINRSIARSSQSWTSCEKANGRKLWYQP